MSFGWSSGVALAGDNCTPVAWYRPRVRNNTDTASDDRLGQPTGDDWPGHCLAYTASHHTPGDNWRANTTSNGWNNPPATTGRDTQSDRHCQLHDGESTGSDRASLGLPRRRGGSAGFVRCPTGLPHPTGSSSSSGCCSSSSCSSLSLSSCCTCCSTHLRVRYETHGSRPLHHTCNLHT